MTVPQVPTHVSNCLWRNGCGRSSCRQLPCGYSAGRRSSAISKWFPDTARVRYAVCRGFAWIMLIPNEIDESTAPRQSKVRQGEPPVQTHSVRRRFCRKERIPSALQRNAFITVAIQLECVGIKPMNALIFGRIADNSHADAMGRPPAPPAAPGRRFVLISCDKCTVPRNCCRVAEIHPLCAENQQENNVCQNNTRNHGLTIQRAIRGPSPFTMLSHGPSVNGASRYCPAVRRRRDYAESTQAKWRRVCHTGG